MKNCSPSSHSSANAMLSFGMPSLISRDSRGQQARMAQMEREDLTAEMVSMGMLDPQALMGSEASADPPANKGLPDQEARRVSAVKRETEALRGLHQRIAGRAPGSASRSLMANGARKWICVALVAAAALFCWAVVAAAAPRPSASSARTITTRAMPTWDLHRVSHELITQSRRRWSRPQLQATGITV